MKPSARTLLEAGPIMAGLICALAVHAAEPAPSAEAPIELPKFTVTDSQILPDPEPWRYGTVPGFEILSNASDRSTQQLIRDFELFRMALELEWNVPKKPGPPTPIIISARKGKFDDFVPAGKDLSEGARASLFFTDRERSAIVIDFEAKTLNVLSNGPDDPATGTDSSIIEVDHNKQLYREYVRSIMSQSVPRPPAWFEEGMAQIMMGIEFRPDFIEFGRLDERNTVSAAAAAVAEANTAALAEDPEASLQGGAPIEDLDFNSALFRRRLLPLQQFFEVKHDAPEANNPLGSNIWAKQAYCFVHMCLYGEGERYKPAFTKWISRLAKEPPTEELFVECFGMNYKKFTTVMRGYVDATNYKSKQYRAKKGQGLPKPAPLVLRDATESEVGRIKGQAFDLAGHKDRARTALIAPYIRGERDPQLLASLGLHELGAGETDRARKFLDAAAAGKTTNGRALVELARLRFADARSNPLGENGRLNFEQTTAVVSPIKAAAALQPPLADGFRLAAQAWSLSAVKPTQDDVAVLIRGALAFPRDLGLVYAGALFSAQTGLVKEAGTLARHGIEYSPDAKARARFEDVLKSLPPEAQGAPPEKKS